MIAWADDAKVCVVVSGRDRFSWLNGVLSSDVKQLEGVTGVRAQLACALDQKGRVISDVVVFAADAVVHAWIARRTADALLEAWDRYIVMEDVELARDESVRLFYVSGEGGATAVQGLRAAAFDGLGEPGFVLEGDAMNGVAGVPLLDAEAARARQVELGRPTFGVDYDEKNYVHEAGLEGRAVSFTKGCYLGQEVVCMLQMRGHVGKRLVRLAVPEAMRPGAELRAEGQLVGAITSVAGTTALAMVKWAAAKPGNQLESEAGLARVTAFAG